MFVPPCLAKMKPALPNKEKTGLPGLPIRSPVTTAK